MIICTVFFWLSWCHSWGGGDILKLPSVVPLLGISSLCVSIYSCRSLIASPWPPGSLPHVYIHFVSWGQQTTTYLCAIVPPPWPFSRSFPLPDCPSAGALLPLQASWCCCCCFLSAGTGTCSKQGPSCTQPTQEAGISRTSVGLCKREEQECWLGIIISNTPPVLALFTDLATSPPLSRPPYACPTPSTNNRVHAWYLSVQIFLSSCPIQRCKIKFM